MLWHEHSPDVLCGALLPTGTLQRCVQCSEAFPPLPNGTQGHPKVMVGLPGTPDGQRGTDVTGVGGDSTHPNNNPRRRTHVD